MGKGKGAMTQGEWTDRGLIMYGPTGHGIGDWILF